MKEGVLKEATVRKAFLIFTEAKDLPSGGRKASFVSFTRRENSLMVLQLRSESEVTQNTALTSALSASRSGIRKVGETPGPPRAAVGSRTQKLSFLG